MLAGSYARLARFAGNLATCLEAGVDVEQALRTTKRALANTRMGDTLEMAIVRVKKGAELSDALEGSSAVWPSFFLPVLKSGERTGRTDEALRYLEHHCQLLTGPVRAVQNAILFPMAIMLAGSALRFALYCGHGEIGSAIGLLFNVVFSYGSLALTVFLLVAPPIRPLIDPAKLAIPWIGDALRELGVNPFFHVMAMTYATAGQRVEVMIRTAGHTVVNVALRDDLLRSIDEIEKGQPLARAFETCRYLTPDEKDSISVGDISGTLEKSFERIFVAAGESLAFKCGLVERFAVKITMAMVTFSLIGTLMQLILM